LGSQCLRLGQHTTADFAAGHGGSGIRNPCQLTAVPPAVEPTMPTEGIRLGDIDYANNAFGKDGSSAETTTSIAAGDQTETMLWFSATPRSGDVAERGFGRRARRSAGDLRDRSVLRLLTMTY
jgi:hypothetical protein